MTGKLALAWLVHLYTALGAVVAFVTIIFIEQFKFQEAFWLMSLAVVIDATDGTLARAARVKQILPWFDGDRLEDIIDYANYVIVPCWFFILAQSTPSRRRAMAFQPPASRQRLWLLPTASKNNRQFFSRFPVLLEYHCVLFLCLQSPPWINALCNSPSLTPCFRSDQIHLPQSKPALSRLNEYPWRLWG